MMIFLSNYFHSGIWEYATDKLLKELEEPLFLFSNTQPERQYTHNRNWCLSHHQNYGCATSADFQLITISS